MPENNQNQQNSGKNPKQRLGRGLGSLLGGSGSQGGAFDEPANSPTANAVAKLTSTPIEPTQPKEIQQEVANKVASAPIKEAAATGTVASPARAAIIGRIDLKTGAPIEPARPINVKAEPKPEPKIESVAAEVSAAPAFATPAISSEVPKQETKPETKSEISTALVSEPKVETGPVAAIPDNARIWTVPVEKLVANTQQPRQVFEDAALKELSASIREKGILQPITARRLSDHEFEIIAGERRWRAAQMAGLKEVPVILKTVSEQDSLELAILENIQRADLNPIEEAEAYDHLMKTYHLTQAQVADRLGKERSSIANALRLMALPPEVKLMIGGGELSSGHAKVLLGLESMSDQISLAKEVIREKLSVRALEKKVAEKKSAGAGATAGPRPAMGLDVSSKLVEALAVELQKLIGTRVVIDYADRRGKLSVYFHSDEQLTEVVERMRRGWAKSSATQNSTATVSSRV